MAYDLGGAFHDDEMICLYLVIVPSLDHVWIGDGDVALSELLKLRPIMAEHLHKIASLVMYLSKLSDLHAFNHLCPPDMIASVQDY
jgi:hypothetical protein